MNTTKAWVILTVIAGLAAFAMLGWVVGSYLETHMRDRMVVSCLKVEGTDLAYCQRLVAQVVL